MRTQKLQLPIVMLLIAIAIILAAGVFLAVNIIQNRNSAEEGEMPSNNFLITVGAEQISLQVDPNLRPVILEPQIVDDTPRTENTSDQQVQEATATPEPTAVPAQNQAATAVPAPAVAKIIFIDYTVQQGDTLYSISDRLDTSISLMAENDIAQDNLVPGQIIRLPIGNPEFCAGRGRPYAIGEGDTVYNLSQRFNTTPQNLQTINSLDANFTIRTADIICIP
jgi:LysM repeat protein